MLAIAVRDAESFIIPDVLSLPAIPAGLISAGLLADDAERYGLVLEHAVAACISGAILLAARQLYFVWREREGLGLGDVKLAAVAGAWTGVQGFARVLLLACLLAISVVLLARLVRRSEISATTAVPLGVFLGPSIWIVWCLHTLEAAGSIVMPIGLF